MDDWLVLKLGPEYPVCDIDFLVHGAGHPVFFGYYSIANIGTPILVMKAHGGHGHSIGSDLSASGGDTHGSAEPGGSHGRRAHRMDLSRLPDVGRRTRFTCSALELFLVGTWLLMLAVNAKGARHAMPDRLSTDVLSGLNSLMALYVFVLFGLLTAVWRALGREPGAATPVRLVDVALHHRVSGFYRAPAAVVGRPQYLVRARCLRHLLQIHAPTFSELRSGSNAFFQMGCMNVLARAGQMTSDHWYRLVLVGAVATVTRSPWPCQGQAA